MVQSSTAAPKRFVKQQVIRSQPVLCRAVRGSDACCQQQQHVEGPVSSAGAFPPVWCWAAASTVHAVVQVPDDILHDEALNEAISLLPANYNFEVRRSESCAHGAAAAGVGIYESCQQHLYSLWFVCGHHCEMMAAIAATHGAAAAGVSEHYATT